MIFSGKSKQLFGDLSQLKDLKTEYDKYLTNVSVKPEDQIVNLPWKQWKEDMFVKQKSLLHRFLKKKVKKTIRNAGIVAFNDLDDTIRIAMQSNR